VSGSGMAVTTEAAFRCRPPSKGLGVLASTSLSVRMNTLAAPPRPFPCVLRAFVDRRGSRTPAALALHSRIRPPRMPGAVAWLTGVEDRRVLRLRASGASVKPSGMQTADKLKLVEAVVQRRLESGEYSRKPTEEEWAEVWQLIKARPDMPEDLVANTVFAALVSKPSKSEAMTETNPSQPTSPSYSIPGIPSSSDSHNRFSGGKVCPDCGRSVASNARTCPNCGHTFTTIGGVFIAVILALAIGGCIIIRAR